MKLLLLLVLLASSFSVFADQIESRIDSIDDSVRKGVPHLIKLENGRVVFVKFANKRVLNAFKFSLKKQDTLKIEVNEKNDYISAETIELSTEEVPVLRPTIQASFEPSVVSLGQATAIFSRMRRNYQDDSQCYNRAHIWAWEEFNKTQLNSSKLFLFFTNRYIRNYHYKWWFHVSPMVATKEGDRVLDRRFTTSPRTKASWVSNFVTSGRGCPIVNKYYDYRNNQEKEDCYLIPVSMYFWQPRDIEYRDRTGFEKTSYKKSEVDYAYWEAF
jgi:hypothetical protein